MDWEATFDQKQLYVIDSLIKKNQNYQKKLQTLIESLENQIQIHQKIVFSINKNHIVTKSRLLKPWALRVNFYPYDTELYQLPSNLLLSKFCSKKKSIIKDFSNKEDVYQKIMKQEFPFEDDGSSDSSSLQLDYKRSNAQQKQIIDFINAYEFPREESFNNDPVENNQIIIDIQNIDWIYVKREISRQTNLKISILEIYKVFVQEKNIFQYIKKWTEQEDELIRKTVQLYGDKKNSWNQIANHIDGKSPYQCYQRWFKYLDPEITKGKWSLLQDLKLVILSQMQRGEIKWVNIANQLHNRTDVQVRERYCNILDTKLSNLNWAIEESLELWSLVQKYGKKWSFIAKQIKGKTDNQCSRKYTQLNKQNHKIQDLIENFDAQKRTKKDQIYFKIVKKKKLTQR